MFSFVLNLINKMNFKTAIVRREHFNSAHRLHNAMWSDEKNIAVFGKCNNPNYHGHNYEIEVKVTGEIDKATGYVIDLKILKTLIEQEIIQRFDHKNLNLDTKEFKDLNPTAENIVVIIWIIDSSSSIIKMIFLIKFFIIFSIL